MSSGELEPKPIALNDGHEKKMTGNTAPKSSTKKKYNQKFNRYYQNLETHKRPK